MTPGIEGYLSALRRTVRPVRDCTRRRARPRSYEPSRETNLGYNVWSLGGGSALGDRAFEAELRDRNLTAPSLFGNALITAFLAPRSLVEHHGRRRLKLTLLKLLSCLMLFKGQKAKTRTYVSRDPAGRKPTEWRTPNRGPLASVDRVNDNGPTLHGATTDQPALAPKRRTRAPSAAPPILALCTRRNRWHALID